MRRTWNAFGTEDPVDFANQGPRCVVGGVLSCSERFAVHLNAALKNHDEKTNTDGSAQHQREVHDPRTCIDFLGR